MGSGASVNAKTSGGYNKNINRWQNEMSQSQKEQIELIKVEEYEEGYPDPAPPDRIDGIIKPKYRWFDDDDFNNARDDVDLLNFDTSTDNHGMDIDQISDFHYPTRKTKPTVQFDEVDKHARSASPSLLESFDALTCYLMAPFDNDRYRKMKIARAIVVWMSNQLFDNKHFGTASLHTPRGLLQYLREERLSYTSFYTIMCRKAGLQCVIVKGHVKEARYEPGNADVPKTTWAAVHVESGWQIVKPSWICRALYGHNFGGWVKVEEDGTTMAKREQAAGGVLTKTFREQYFMPDPEEFIYICCASDTVWQLVKPTSIVASKQHFLEKPYLLPPFFGAGLELVSEPTCVLYSNDGFCKVELRGKSANAHMLMFKYELFMKDAGESWPNEEDMSKMVFNSRAGDTFAFDIRFPRKGTYKLVIYGGPYNSKRFSGRRLCEFLLVCGKEMVERGLLPLDCSDIGWGPGPKATEAGLLMPSKRSGLIPVNKSEKTAEMKFQLRDGSQEYSAQMHGEVGGRRRTYDENVHITSTKEQLAISATLPSEGEFGVSVNHVVLTSDDTKQETNICNYLLSTIAYKGIKADVKLAKKKLEDVISEDVDESQWKNKISKIDENINKCLDMKIPETDDDIAAARTYRELLWVKDKLRDCILRRNLGVARRTLEIVLSYKNKEALKKEIEAVKKLEKELAQGSDSVE